VLVSHSFISFSRSCPSLVLTYIQGCCYILDAITGSSKRWSACCGAHLGTGSNLGALFLVMLGLMALRALMGASALAAVPIWVASDAYYSSAKSTQSTFLSTGPMIYTTGVWRELTCVART